MVQFALPENSKILKGNYYKDKTGSKNLKKVNVYRWNPDDGKNPRIDTFEIDLNKMTVRLNDKYKKINNSEKKVLIEMLANPGITFSREDIGKISGISQERSIDVMITRLRQKLELNPKNPKYLQTIRGSGYVLWIE